MRYFFDTEFHEREVNGNYIIEPISIGIVSEDGKQLYLECREFDIKAAIENKWLHENVIMKLDLYGKYTLGGTFMGYQKTYIANRIVNFVGNDTQPEFYAYYAAYDWVVFCQLFGGMMKLPKHFPMYCRDLKHMLDEKIQIYLLYNSEEYNQFQFSEGLMKIEENLWCYTQQENEHRAIDDAVFNKNLYECMMGSYIEDILGN